MKALAYVALPLMLILLAYWTRQDLSEYAAFKKLKSTKSRQDSYKRWIIQSFLILGLTSVLALIGTGHLGDLVKPLAELSQALPYRSSIQK